MVYLDSDSFMEIFWSQERLRVRFVVAGLLLGIYLPTEGSHELACSYYGRNCATCLCKLSGRVLHLSFVPFLRQLTRMNPLKRGNGSLTQSLSFCSFLALTNHPMPLTTSTSNLNLKSTCGKHGPDATAVTKDEGPLEFLEVGKVPLGCQGPAPTLKARWLRVGCLFWLKGYGKGPAWVP